MIKHLKPAIAVICGGILALSFPMIQQVASQPATPGIEEFEQVEIDSLISSQFTDLPPSMTVGLQRITFAPGGVLDIQYAGPTIYLVETGEVSVSFQENTGIGFIDTNSPGREQRQANRERRRRSEDGVLLGPGQAISAPQGNLGRTTNPGDSPATVLAILLVPYDESAYEGESFMVTAEPMPTKAP